MITNEVLEKIDSHWAVLAVGNEQTRESILQFAKAKLVKNAVGEQLNLNLKASLNSEEDINRLAMAYEIVAIEGIDDFINNSDNTELCNQFLAGSYRTFELRKTLKIPKDNDLQFMLHLLHLSALAYCGDSWTDLENIYSQYSREIKSLSDKQPNEWDEHILFQLFKCWVNLFKRSTWNDIDNIYAVIAKLREEQKQFEEQYLNNYSDIETKHKTLRLVLLYHWARATELLAEYMLQGEPAGIKAQLERHFDMATRIARDIGDAQLEILLRWLYASAEQMVGGSIWWVAQTINSKATEFIGKIVKKSKPLLEFLPPQRIAIKEMGLLDPAKTAIVVEMPTSGGKTMLAEFKILQAINNFRETKGWVAYVAPTKALVAQITRRLRQDFSPIGINVEQLNSAVEIDIVEEDLLETEQGFDILVATPEKMQLVLRNRRIKRPLSLFVMDEAHNIEDKNRGLRIELLLATVKQHYQARANFLLLMPYVENTETLARWLAHDKAAGLSISLSTTPWKPNERIIGLVEKKQRKERGNWELNYQTLTTTPKTIHLQGNHQIGHDRPINIPISQANLSNMVAGCAKTFACRGTSIAIGRNPKTVWNIAKILQKNIADLNEIPAEIKLVQNYLKTEVSPQFELIDMLNKGIGIHHAKLSDEIKSLMEWLVEENKLNILCATTTIAQGVNFPVSSIFLQSIEYPYGEQMRCREFWNLVGRAGRLGQDNVGVIGIACDTDEKKQKLTNYVKKSTGNLVSRLVSVLKDLKDQDKLEDLEEIWNLNDLEDFRCYIAHLLNEKEGLQNALNEMDQMLTNTFGYSELKTQKPEWSNKLLEATKKYAEGIARNMGRVAQADITGFSVESIIKAQKEIGQLEYNLTANDWKPNSLFGESNSKLPDLFKVMFEINQLHFKPDDQPGRTQTRMAEIAQAWITGKTIQEIATKFFDGEDDLNKISDAYRFIYGKLTYGGTWGLSALSQISNLDIDTLPEEDKRQIKLIPAMIYHGVDNEEAVLMRMNSVPRSFANQLGKDFKQKQSDRNIITAREYLMHLTDSDWNSATTSEYLSGKECKEIWHVLSGEINNHT